MVGGRILLHVINHLNHGKQRAQAVGQSAAATGLLSHTAVTQRDLLILFSHGVFPYAHLGKDKAGILVRRLFVRRYRQANRRLHIL